jgi:polyphosphate glucokinase
MRVLAVDVGGTHVKVLATGQTEPRRFPSGPKMTAKQMVSGVKELTRDWKYDAFGRPVKIINDAAMQALGSYKSGTLLFLGLGTGLGSALVVQGNVVPMELGHLSYKKGTYEDYVGIRGLERLGKKKWARHVEFGVARLIDALHPDDVVLGGGNAKKLKKLPSGCRKGDNANAFVGGFRLWDEAASPRRTTNAKTRS